MAMVPLVRHPVSIVSEIPVPCQLPRSTSVPISPLAALRSHNSREDFGTSNGVVELMFIALFMGLESGDKRRRYLRTGSFDFFVGDDSGVFERLGVFEGVVGPVVGVACVVKVVSWS